MKKGDEVWLKSEGEFATRRIIKTSFYNQFILEYHHQFVDYGVAYSDDELQILSPTDRLWSELKQIARLTNCWVAVNEDGKVCIDGEKMYRDANSWWIVEEIEPPAIMHTITCPNCPDYTKQINPHGEMV